jgi:hypothetical protein
MKKSNSKRGPKFGGLTVNRSVTLVFLTTRFGKTKQHDDGYNYLLNMETQKVHREY